MRFRRTSDTYCALIAYAALKVIALMSFDHYLQSSEAFYAQDGSPVEIPDVIICTVNGFVEYIRHVDDANWKNLTLRSYKIADLPVASTLCSLEHDTVTLFTAQNTTLDSRYGAYIRLDIHPVGSYDRTSAEFGDVNAYVFIVPSSKFSSPGGIEIRSTPINTKRKRKDFVGLWGVTESDPHYSVETTSTNIRYLGQTTVWIDLPMSTVERRELL
ncbi:hypothetical protein BGZ83_007973 [Gryganskiella cystojenkinii]|nr:hypothetical protein BGZ83_007973 [Gryganskiella cystojenkinii]